MKMKWIAVGMVGLGLGMTSAAQDVTPPAAEQGSGQSPVRGRGMGVGGWAERGVLGTVTETASDSYTIKNEAGEVFTVHISPNTRIVKSSPPPAGPGQPGVDSGRGMGARRTPPQPIKADDIKPGDAIMAMGEVDQSAHSVGAVMVMLIDPERAKKMEEMRANFGKTWLVGRVTAVQETKVTLHSAVDNAEHNFVADENTSFRRRREPITLGDVHVGDSVRVDGAIKDGEFVASSVMVMMPPVRSGPVQRPGPPPQ